MPNPRIGRMRHSVTISWPDETDIDTLTGQVYPTGTTSESVTVWAAIEWDGGGESQQSDQNRSKRTGKMICRKPTSTLTITPACYVTFGSRRFNVVSVINIDDRNAFLECGIEELTTGAA